MFLVRESRKAETRTGESAWNVFLRGSFDLEKTLRCGQAFRWQTHGDGFRGVVGNRGVYLREKEGFLWISGPRDPNEKDSVLHYLGLQDDLTRIEKTLRRDSVLSGVVPKSSGMALLCQDPFETLMTFMISANNNIPRIQGILDRLSRRLGKSLQDGLFTFPTPEALAEVPISTFEEIGTGYRAPFLRETARRVAHREVDFEALRILPFEEARKELLRLPGVGEKVADCVLLFGLSRREAFPVDVWVRRAVEVLYFWGKTLKLKEIQAFARERFGPLAEYAQEHLYYYARNFL